jgi:hypothetical protein
MTWNLAGGQPETALQRRILVEIVQCFLRLAHFWRVHKEHRFIGGRRSDTPLTCIVIVARLMGFLNVCPW